MAIDIDALVAPLAEDAPSGPDLSYDPERQEMEAAFDRPVDGENDGGGPDWRAIVKLVIGQAEKTRDLWLAVYLMRAAARAGDFELVAEGGELLARLTEERWADVHPQLDEVGFQGRKTPCESLTRVADFLGPLARLPLLSHERLGKYAGNDFQRFAESGSAAEGYGMFRALLDATGPDALGTIVDRIDGLRGSIERVDAVLVANAGAETGANFNELYKALDTIRKAVASQLPVDPDAPLADEPAATGPMPGGPVASGAFTGAIASRGDVVRALDAIIAYFGKAEPASPVPLLLLRAREWTSLDFLEVLEDIVPNSLEDAKRILKSSRSPQTAAAGWAAQAAAPAQESASAAEAKDDGW